MRAWLVSCYQARNPRAQIVAVWWQTGRIFWEDFLGGSFWEDLFGRIFWEEFFGGYFWEEFFFSIVKVSKVILNLKGIYQDFVSMEKGGRRATI